MEVFLILLWIKGIEHFTLYKLTPLLKSLEFFQITNLLRLKIFFTTEQPIYRINLEMAFDRLSKLN